MTPLDLVVVTLGADDARRWSGQGGVRSVVDLPRATTTGYRAGSLAMGLGADAMRVALRAVTTTRHGVFVATNPWIGVALRLLSRRPIVVLGVYAAPGSRNWKVLRRALGNNPVITTARVEATNWVADGGRATHVLYGNTFPYPAAVADRPTERLRIFVGGSSDRESAFIERLEQEVLTGQGPVTLIVATGGPASRRTGGGGEVVHHERLSQQDFGRLLASADVAFLPLRDGARAAGHMLTVGALQVGVPVAATPCVGMEGYEDGTFVRRIDPAAPLLPQLVAVADDAPDAHAIVDFWRETFSRDAFVRRVLQAVEGLDRVDEQVAR